MPQFIESIKVEDQKVYLIDLHQKRLNDTFHYFNKTPNINLLDVFKALKVEGDGLFKMRVLYDLEGKYSVRLIPYAILEISHFEIITDNDIEYNFKYENRKNIDRYKNQSEANEVIFVKNKCITDTSFSNLLFLKNKTWYTPNTYLLNGVQRQNLLQTKKIKELEITLDNINEFTHFQIINAMNDFDDMFVYPINKIINLPIAKNDIEI